MKLFIRHAEIYANVPGMKTFHATLESAQDVRTPSFCRVSLVNKCTCVFPSITMTDFTTVVEENTVSQL